MSVKKKTPVQHIILTPALPGSKELGQLYFSGSTIHNAHSSQWLHYNFHFLLRFSTAPASPIKCGLYCNQDCNFNNGISVLSQCQPSAAISPYSSFFTTLTVWETREHPASRGTCSLGPF